MIEEIYSVDVPPFTSSVKLTYCFCFEIRLLLEFRLKNFLIYLGSDEYSSLTEPSFKERTFLLRTLIARLGVSLVSLMLDDLTNFLKPGIS